MASLTHTTTDHDEIRTWVEEHDGVPATVRTEDEDEVSILRIDFPGGAGEDRLRQIEWDEWFEKFDQRKLAFIYQEHKANGDDSTFFKLVDRDS